MARIPTYLDSKEIHIWNGVVHRPALVAEAYHLTGVPSGNTLTRTGMHDIDYRAKQSRVEIHQFFTSSSNANSFRDWFIGLPSIGTVQLSLWSETDPFPCFVLDSTVNMMKQVRASFGGAEYNYVLGGTIVLEALQ